MKKDLLPILNLLSFTTYSLSGVETRPSFNSNVTNQALDDTIAIIQGFFVKTNIVGALRA